MGDRVRAFTLVVAFVTGSVLPGCRNPECGATRGDELERHGPRTLRAVNEGRGDQALRELGVALGLSAHDPTFETTENADPRFMAIGLGLHGERRGRGRRGPKVRAGLPDILGPLPFDAIRRVVLRNLGQVNHCHEQGLATNPNAAGHVTVRFVINGTGNVMGSGVAGSTYPIASVAACIAEVTHRWQFPAPEAGGVVTVYYPFDLLLHAQ